MSFAKRPLGKTGLSIAPLVLGGNVFGWTAAEKTSFAVLDAFVGAGFNCIDTADVYSSWVPGHTGGESESIIGRWMKVRGNRDKIVLVTKVGSDMGSGRKDLSSSYIGKAVDASLRRLQTDYIDVYLAHWEDPTAVAEDTMQGFADTVRQGKVRAIGASNHLVATLRATHEASRKLGLPRYQVTQPHYNLYTRAEYEEELEDYCAREGLGVITYFALGKGFLTGKYRSRADLDKSPRGEDVGDYLNPRGMRILAALDEVAEDHGATLAQVALAWVMARPSVTAPIASATNVAQVRDITKAASIRLSGGDIGRLNDASAL